VQDVFLLCLGAGALVLVGQIILDLIGSGGLAVDHGIGDGLDLLSVRSMSAGTMLFGAVGLWLSSRGMPVFVTVPAGALGGFAGMVATAYLTRQMMRLESDGTLRIDRAIGQPGTVYLPIPAHREGHGMVQFTLQGRTIELRAVADEATLIPSGAPVIIVSVMDDDTVEVTPTPQLEGIDA
jgi:hypothetical protein